MPDPDRTIHITANTAGVPSAARCECGATWERPDDDEVADTLIVFGRDHECLPSVKMAKDKA